MSKLLKITTPFIICLGVLSLFMCNVLEMQNFLLDKVVYNGQTIFKFNVFGYFDNFNGSIAGFKNSIVSIGNTPISFDSLTNGLRSIGNIVISLLNVGLLPFAIITTLLNVAMAIVGLPCNDTNFIYRIFNTISSLQIPYIPLD